jgi:adenosine deaminase
MSDDEVNDDVKDMDETFFKLTELIQSSPSAIEQSVYSTIGGAYRSGNVILHELRFNPMKRNRRGERDLDHIIMSAIWGKEKALLEYPEVKAGIVLILDRGFSFELNEILINKAIKYHRHGIVGVDLAGPYNDNFDISELTPLFKKAKEAGLGVTVHTGEEGSLEEMKYVIQEIQPDRIGHGVLVGTSDEALQILKDSGITLEICPTSNLKNSVFGSVEELKAVYQNIAKWEIPFVICTDGPELYNSNVKKECEFLLENGIFTDAEIEAAQRRAYDVTFVGSIKREREGLTQ